MPLLHTWSLAVEEQFYLVWPATLLLGSRYVGTSRRAWTIILAIIIGASFARALVMAGRDPKADFYLIFSRAWELALGGLLVVLAPAATRMARWLSEALPVIGLGMILYAAMSLSSAAPFPSFNALLPTIGAALVIFPRGTATGIVLGVAPMRFVGLISYSLYLWHWPLIVFWRVYNNGLSPGWPDMLGIAAVAFALSVFSWRFIEQPARRIKMPTPAVLATALACNAAALGIAAAIALTSGFPGRLPADLVALDGKEKMWAWRCPQSVELGVLANTSTAAPPSCGYGADWKTARHRAVIWGDSLSQHLAPILDFAGRRADTSIAEAYACAAITEQGAPRFVAADRTKLYETWCDMARSRVIALITGNNDIDTVLLSTSWSSLWALLDPQSETNGRQILRTGLDSLLQSIITAGKRPIVIAEAPTSVGPDPASCVMAERALPRRRCIADPAWIDRASLRSQTETLAMLKEVVARHPAARIVDPVDFLCDAARCRKFVADELIYRDAVHLRRNLRPETIAALAAGLRAGGRACRPGQSARGPVNHTFA